MSDEQSEHSSLPSRERGQGREGDPRARLLLTRAAKILALLGLGFVAYPFLATFLPEDSIDAARQQRWQREIDVSGMQPGDLQQIDDWPGGPVAVYRRSAHELEGLGRIEDQLHDPRSQRSTQPETLRTTTRSHTPEYFVFIPAETGRGCHVRYIPADKQPKPDIAWYGGFVDLCSGSLYDTAGRAYRAYRGERQQNLAVPDYTVLDDRRIQLDARMTKVHP